MDLRSIVVYRSIHTFEVRETAHLFQSPLGLDRPTRLIGTSILVKRSVPAHTGPAHFRLPRPGANASATGSAPALTSGHVSPPRLPAEMLESNRPRDSRPHTHRVDVTPGFSFQHPSFRNGRKGASAGVGRHATGADNHFSKSVE